MKEIGPQYALDDSFKAAARLHQSKYRAAVLGVDYLDYGNRLTDSDGRALLNYYDALGIRSALRKRYPDYASRRDADLLRSEHIPFNMLAPFAGRPDWAPEPKSVYLDDMTSFDAYIQGVGADGELMGIGIEVKYTERGYRIGKTEKARVDDLRQIWRNHLLGLAMVRHGDIKRFVSITLYPSGNVHFTHSLARYQDHLKDLERNSVIGCTFERLIECIRGDQEIERWKQFLIERYLIE